MYDPEVSIQDADIEMAEMAAVGDAVARQRARGVCQHQSAAGYIDPPVYPEQRGLQPGQVACTEGCGAVFASDVAWFEAMDLAADGIAWPATGPQRA